MLAMSLGSPRDLVRRGADRHGERQAVVAADQGLTYRELAARTAATAVLLRQAGVDAGVQVALLLPNSIAYLVWYFGVLEAGGVVVPLTANITAPEAKGLLEGAGIRFLAVPKLASLPDDLGMTPVSRPGPTEGVCLWQMQRPAPALDTKPGKPEGLLTRQFSSGSTGRPKHMLKTEANIAHSYEHFCRTLGLAADDVFLGVAPFTHYGAASFLAAFHVGGCVAVVPRFLPGPVLEMARRCSPTVFLTTPPMIDVLGSCVLAEGEARALSSLKVCICSTARLSRSPYDTFLARFRVPVRIQYGCTEASSVTIDLEDGYHQTRVGRPYDGVQVGIFDDDGQACDVGQHGQIGIRSRAACDRYVLEAEATARTFRNGYVFPGDLGYLDATGCMHLVGRSDIINVGGYKVDRLEVEAVIREALPVRDVIVLEGHRAGLPAVRAVIEADPDSVTRAMVVEACRKRLSKHKVPAQVDILRRFERDDRGNVIRSSFDD